MSVVNSTEVVVEVTEVTVTPILVLVSTIGLVVVLAVNVTAEEIIRSC